MITFLQTSNFFILLTLKNKRKMFYSIWTPQTSKRIDDIGYCTFEKIKRRPLFFESYICDFDVQSKANIFILWAKCYTLVKTIFSDNCFYLTQKFQKWIFSKFWKFTQNFKFQNCFWFSSRLLEIFQSFFCLLRAGSWPIKYPPIVSPINGGLSDENAPDQ